MPSRDLPARVAAATAAAARDREPCCVYCRATADLEPWAEEHLPTGFACRDADACRLRFLALNRVPDTTGDLRGRETARAGHPEHEYERELEMRHQAEEDAADTTNREGT